MLPYRALLISNDQATRDWFLGMVTDSSGHAIRIDCAEDYGEAVELAGQSNYGVVLLDSALGDPTGLLRKSVDEKVLPGPFLQLIDRADAKLERRVIEAGAADTLPKDKLTAELLVRTVRHAVEIRRAERQMADLAVIDPITGLASRALFWEFLSLGIRRAKRNKDHLAILLIQLGGLDRPGSGGTPEIDDGAVGAVAGRLTAVLRASDSVARFNDTQMIVMVESMPRVEDIQVVCEKIIESVTQPYQVDGHAFPITANVGISMYPASAAHAEGLIRNATSAMIAAQEKATKSFQFA